MSCRPFDQVVEAVVKASSWSLENFWKSSNVGVVTVIRSSCTLSRFRIGKGANSRCPQYVQCTMKVKGVLLRCNKIVATGFEAIANKIKKRKLFQIIALCY